MTTQIPYQKWLRIIPEIPEQNCQFLERYLEIEQINFLIKNEVKMSESEETILCKMYDNFAENFKVSSHKIRKQKIQEIFLFLENLVKVAQTAKEKVPDQKLVSKTEKKTESKTKTTTTPKKVKSGADKAEKESPSEKQRKIEAPNEKPEEVTEKCEFNSELIVFKKKPEIVEEITDQNKDKALITVAEVSSKKDTNKLQVLCKKCSEKTPANKSICLFCGEKLIQTELRKKKVCNICNAFEATEFETNFNFKFCFNCEEPLEEVQYEHEIPNFENGILSDCKNIYNKIGSLIFNKPHQTKEKEAIIEKKPDEINKTESVEEKTDEPRKIKFVDEEPIPDKTKIESSIFQAEFLSEIKKLNTICNEIPAVAANLSDDISILNKTINLWIETIEKLNK